MSSNSTTTILEMLTWLIKSTTTIDKIRTDTEILYGCGPFWGVNFKFNVPINMFLSKF